jgi:hypothetical protein
MWQAGRPMLPTTFDMHCRGGITERKRSANEASVD